MNNFKKALLSILHRLKNPGTVISIASGIVIILNELGYIVDSESISVIVNTVCSILIALGIMNDSTSDTMYIPGIKDKLINEKKEPKVQIIISEEAKAAFREASKRAMEKNAEVLKTLSNIDKGDDNIDA